MMFGMCCAESLGPSLPLQWSGQASSLRHLNINAVHKEEQDKNKFCAAPLGKSRHEKKQDAKALTAHTRPTRVCMAPSLSPSSVAFSVKKK